MARQIIIDFDSPADVHRVRNFGEDLYGACRDDGWASISLAEVDRATNQLRVTVRSARRVRRVAAMIEKLLERHHFTDTARLTHLNTTD
jgi:hypothetical protein